VVKSDGWIIRMARDTRMIDPFEPRQVKAVVTDNGPQSVISYGVSSYGYDIRVDNKFKVLDPKRAGHGPVSSENSLVGTVPANGNLIKEWDGVIDPKNFDLSHFKDYEGDVCVIPPHGMAIAMSYEYFRIPRDVLVICSGKSTYSRCGVLVNIAPLEPEWEGKLTFSINNTAGQPAKIYAREGIAQILFLEADEVCLTSYADKKGKYQGQTVLTPPTV
jgi:dCTP deaminase